jgi:hypothetical protein
VARLESGFPSLQKKAWYQKKPLRENRRIPPILKENLPKCSSIIISAVVPRLLFLAAKLY